MSDNSATSSPDASPGDRSEMRFTVDTIRAFVPAARRPYEYALVYSNVFSGRQCDRILEHAAGLATGDAHVGDGFAEIHHDDGIRRSRIAWIPADDSSGWIYNKLASIVRRANRSYGFDLIGFTEDLQFTEYSDVGCVLHLAPGRPRRRPRRPQALDGRTTVGSRRLRRW